MQKSLLHAIGNTPLVQVKLNIAAHVYAKLEYLNPGGSIKDRSALYLIEYAEQRGILRPGGTIIDASSGNHGIALAMIGRIKGYRVVITVTTKISKEKYDTLKAYGAEVIMCPATPFIEDPQSYHSVAKKLHDQTPNSFMPDQYFNPMNADAHEALLGPEIWQQTEGKITHFFAGAGTGGTISGVGRYLKKQNPAIKILALDTANSYRSTNGNPKPYKIEGIGIDWDSPVLDKNIVDDYIAVSDEQAIGMLKTLASHHGLLVGPSSGAVAYGVQEYMQHLPSDALAVMIFGDSGRAYLSKNFYLQDDELPFELLVQKTKQLSL